MNWEGKRREQGFRVFLKIGGRRVPRPQRTPHGDMTWILGSYETCGCSETASVPRKCEIDR